MGVSGNNTVVVENIDELMLKIKELQCSNPGMNKQVKTIIRSVIKDAVKELRSQAKSVLSNDPRKAYMAVRSAVYKEIFGGQVNILPRRTANSSMYTGGSHSRPRSARTEQLDGYYGSDRGFILRFLNAGTQNRTISTMNAHAMIGDMQSRSEHRTYKGELGNRGRIAGEGWFSNSAPTAMNKAAEKFSELFDRAVEEVWNDNK